MSLGDKLFATENDFGRGIELVKISKIFDLKHFKYLKITNELRNEYCCMFHFLTGKKRNLCKRCDIEVHLKERN